jgi:hypothetical protein
MGHSVVKNENRITGKSKNEKFRTYFVMFFTLFRTSKTFFFSNCVVEILQSTKVKFGMHIGMW